MIRGAGGHIIRKSPGGFVAEFSSVVSAVQFAVDVQQAFENRNASLPEGQRHCITLGINLWDVVVQRESVSEDGILVATRLQESAEQGSILISETVHQHVQRHLQVAFADAGRRSVRDDLNLIPTYRVLANASGQAQLQASGSYQASIAVLPFVNVSRDPELNYISDGMTEEIIAHLSRIASIYVVSPGIAFGYKGKAPNLSQLAVELGVQYIIRGSVSVIDDRVRVSIQLDDGHIASKIMIQHYDRTFDEIFAIQEAITQDVLHALRLKLQVTGRAAPGQQPAFSSEAHRFYLMGRSYFRAGHTKRYLRLAKQMFQRALEREPDYAAAHAGVADCSAFLLEAGDLAISVDEILMHSDRALELDETLAEAHASKGLALYAMCRYEEAETSFQRAIVLQPELFEAYYFSGRNCLNQGQFTRAAELFGQAGKLKRDDFRSFGLQSMCYLSLTQLENARNAARIALVRAEAAVSERPDDADVLSFGAGLLAFLGETKRTIAWAERASIIAPDDYYVQYNIACAYAVIGAKEKAIEKLKSIMTSDIPSSRIEYMMQDSDLDSLRDHPLYKAWIRDLLA